MNDSMRELWTRIEAFEIDDLSRGVPDLTFSQRLASENGWCAGFARRVVEEYKRFLFLAMTAGHSVTTSDEVDQAWHLHMTYTRSYWDRLTREVLPRPLHHDPTRGGGEEDAKFDDWYERTKRSYTAAFGEEPPADVWPSSKVRFNPRLRWQRVNTAEYWMILKRPTRRRLLGTAVLAAGAAAAGGWGADDPRRGTHAVRRHRDCCRGDRGADARGGRGAGHSAQRMRPRQWIRLGLRGSLGLRLWGERLRERQRLRR